MLHFLAWLVLGRHLNDHTRRAHDPSMLDQPHPGQKTDQYFIPLDVSPVRPWRFPSDCDAARNSDRRVNVMLNAEVDDCFDSPFAMNIPAPLVNQQRPGPLGT